MHRFFMIHSFRTFNRFNVASAALFLAAKVEERPQKLEYVAVVYHSHMNRDSPPIDPGSEAFTKLVEEITTHEVLILETLGFDLRVEHAHPHVVKCTQLVRASKDLSQTAYFMAHNSLLLTTFCLEHRPTVVACCCINLARVWMCVDIPPSHDHQNWWEYVDPDITQEMLDSLTQEFLDIYRKSPSKLQKKINEQIKLSQKQSKLKQEGSGSSSSSASTSQGDRSKGSASSHDNSHASSSSSSTSFKHPKLPPPSVSNQIPPQKVNSAHHHHHHHHHHPPPPHHHHKGHEGHHRKMPHPPSSSQAPPPASVGSSSSGRQAHPAHQNSNLAKQNLTSSSSHSHSSLGKGSSSSQAPNRVHNTAKTSGSASAQLMNNKTVPKPSHEGHRGQMVDGSGGGGSGSRSGQHLKQHQEKQRSGVSSSHHSAQKLSKRPHPPSSGGEAAMLAEKKRIKLEAYRGNGSTTGVGGGQQPPLPPLPLMGSLRDAPPLPPMPSHPSYSLSLPPLPRTAPPLPPDDSPPPPPPHN